MCEWVDGQLIISFPKVDLAARALVDAIRNGQIDHVSYIESLDTKLGRLNLHADTRLEFEFHLVSVPAGQELWKVTYLQFFYKHELMSVLSRGGLTPEFQEAFSRSDYQFNVAPNNLLSLAIRWPFEWLFADAERPPVSSVGFSFSEYHDQYKRELGLPLAPRPLDARQIRILVVDTGIADDFPFPVSEQKNFVDQKNPDKATDDNGHGTAVSLIIKDLIPEAQLFVYKVADALGYACEWDTLAALAASLDAHVINISLAFGWNGKKCQICGRESQSSRSQVFETIIDQCQNRTVPSILVAAAGNDHRNELSYPARFGQVLAIESITSKKVLSTPSNYGTSNHIHENHKNCFVLPGGEPSNKNPEGVGRFGDHGELLQGTSFAAAYASGIVANLVAQIGILAYQKDALLRHLQDSADKTFAGYDKDKHGNGLMRLQVL